MNLLLMDWAVAVGLLGALVCWFTRRYIVVAVLGIAIVAVAGYGFFVDRWQLALAGAIGLAFVVLGFVKERQRSDAAPLWSGVLVAAVSVFAIALVYLHPIKPLPTPDGPHAVGVREFVLVDFERNGVLAAAADEPRELLVRVWYPAKPDKKSEVRPYFTASEARTTANSVGNFVGMPFLFRYVRHVRTNSHVDAPLKASGELLPVVIYSHGYTSFAAQNTALMETLASHGYLVFAVHHSHDAAPGVKPDGGIIDSDPELMAAMLEQAEAPDPELVQSFIAPTPAERREHTQKLYANYLERGERIATVSAPVWVADRLFVHNALAAGEVPETVTDVVAAGDFSRTGQIGMSFGGSTSGAVCQIDERCAAAVNLDGGDYHFTTTFNSNLRAPFLMLYSDLDRLAELVGGEAPARGNGFNDFSYERIETLGLRKDVYRFSVKDVLHLGYSDFTWFLRNPLRDLLLGGIDAEAMLTIQNDFVLGFLDRYVRRLDNDFPSAELARHGDSVSPQDVTPVRDWWLEEHPEDLTVTVRMRTSLGDIDIAVYPERAPVSAGQFLSLVDSGTYDGATLYRATKLDETARSIAVVQGGLGINRLTSVAPIEHETTDATGIKNERGSIAFARLEPGTASSEFFFNLADNKVLDTGSFLRNPDGQGFATFGRVLSGLPLLETLEAAARQVDAPVPQLAGEILQEPVQIYDVRRVSGN